MAVDIKLEMSGGYVLVVLFGSKNCSSQQKERSFKSFLVTGKCAIKWAVSDKTFSVCNLHHF